MSLVSFWFFVFLAVSLTVYYIIPGKCQWVMLLAISLSFYALAGTPWTAVYLFLTVAAIWAGSNYIDRIRGNSGKAKAVLIVCLIVALAPLVVLKYSNFFLSSAKMVCGIFGGGQSIKMVNFVASLGVSFYTLQAVGYLVDVYWGTSKPQKSIWKTALFVCYFPQMISGPISRYHQLEDQLYAPHKFEYQRVCFGLQRILIGLIKKLVVAENIAVYANDIFDESANYSGLFLCIGLAVYVIQLYMDFSGCMDIVLGASECFGVYLPENFDRPFHSRSIQEFWKRWHITLGQWLQDYIMYPILRSKLWKKMTKSLKASLGKKVSKSVPTYLAMMILWFYMGLWHGGAWHFVAEGIWFGAVIIVGQLLDNLFKKWKAFFHIDSEGKWWHGFQSARTAVIYAVGVLFFRASTVGRAVHYVKACLMPASFMPGVFIGQLRTFLAPLDFYDFLKSGISVTLGMAVLAVLFVFQAKGHSVYEWLASRNIVVRWAILYFLLFFVILFGMYGPEYDAAQFIYGGF